MNISSWVLFSIVLLCVVSPGYGAVPEIGRSVLGKEWVYVGTYTRPKSRGIYLFEFDPQSGKLAPKGVVAETPSPTFLATDPRNRFLYAVNEEKAGAVSAFALDRQSGKLTFLNKQSSRGDGPCHLVVDASGRNVLVANYGSGSAAVIRIAPDGRLGDTTAFVEHRGSSVNRQRQQGPHAHCVTVDEGNHFAFINDLGLDKIMIYRFDASRGVVLPNDPPSVTLPPGSGPRHFAFQPGGTYAYDINEIGSTLTALVYDSHRGALKELQTVSTLPEGSAAAGNSTAEVQVHPSGKFVYGSNRGHNSIAVFSIDPASGRVHLIQNQSTNGKTPRNFAIAPGGRFLIVANQDSDNLVVFRIDPRSGQLTETGVDVQGPSPVCVLFVPQMRKQMR